MAAGSRRSCSPWRCCRSWRCCALALEQILVLLQSRAPLLSLPQPRQAPNHIHDTTPPRPATSRGWARMAAASQRTDIRTSEALNQDLVANLCNRPRTLQREVLALQDLLQSPEPLQVPRGPHLLTAIPHPAASPGYGRPSQNRLPHDQGPTASPSCSCCH